MQHRVRTALVAVALATATGASVSGCALDHTSAAATTHPPTAYSYIAMAAQPRIAVHRSPGGPVKARLDNPNSFGDPLVLLARGRQGNWLKVLLPIRPNGSTGWVRSDVVRLTWNPWRVVVDRGAHRLQLYDAGHPVYGARVGVGTSATPTPLGTFYITALLRQPDANDAYGPYAFGLSGYSTVIKHFAGGPGEIGLHGTNEPWSIGQSATHGCIRVRNDVITMLAGKLPLGTPVIVRR